MQASTGVRVDRGVRKQRAREDTDLRGLLTHWEDNSCSRSSSASSWGSRHRPLSPIPASPSSMAPASRPTRSTTTGPPAIVNIVRSGLPNPANYVVINCDFDPVHVGQRAPRAASPGQLTSFISSKGITRPRGDHALERRQRDALDHVEPDVRQPLSEHHREDPLGQRARALLRRHAAGRRGDRGQRVRDLGRLAARLQVRRRAPAADELDGDVQRQQPVRHQRTPGAAEGLLVSVVGTDVDSALVGRRQLLRRLLRERRPGDDAALAQQRAPTASSTAPASRPRARVWFQDKTRMAGAEPLSHNQSRRPCFGLDVILRNDV